MVWLYWKTTDALQDSSRLAYTDTINAGSNTLNMKIFGSDVIAGLNKTLIVTVAVTPKPGGINAQCLKLTQGSVKMKVRDI
jgi:hypothetical protein